MNEQGFESLKVWQKAHQLMLDVHKKFVPLLPVEEKFDLAIQIRRSSKSLGANIAEGYGRFYYMDNVRFVITPAVLWMRLSITCAMPAIWDIARPNFIKTYAPKPRKCGECLMAMLSG
jgi:hypothetical protein